MDKYEKNKISDVLEIENYKKGDLIIKEGDESDKFYLIMNGTAEAFKVEENNEKIVFKYG